MGLKSQITKSGNLFHFILTHHLKTETRPDALGRCNDSVGVRTDFLDALSASTNRPALPVKLQRLCQAVQPDSTPRVISQLSLSYTGASAGLSTERKIGNNNDRK
jgi:hypothetical protein